MTELSRAYAVDGVVALDPNRQAELLEAFSEICGKAVESVSANWTTGLPLTHEGFIHTDHPDCRGQATVFVRTCDESGGQGTDFFVFRQNNEGNPWPCDDRGISTPTMHLLWELATSQKRYTEWFDRLTLGGTRPLPADSEPPVPRVTTEHYRLLGVAPVHALMPKRPVTLEPQEQEVAA